MSKNKITKNNQSVASRSSAGGITETGFERAHRRRGFTITGGIASLADLVQFGMDVAVDFVCGVARGQIIVHHRAEPGNVAAAAFAGRQLEVFRDKCPSLSMHA